MNKLIGKYWYLFALVFPVAILIVARSTGTSHFRYDSAKWAEPAFSGTNIYIPGITSLPAGTPLFVDLDRKSPEKTVYNGEHLIISPESILNPDNRKKLASHDGPVILNSSDPGLAARLWMILSQSGITSLYILSSESDNELPKQKFRPDTTNSRN